MVGSDQVFLTLGPGHHFLGYVTDGEFDRVVPHQNRRDNISFQTIPGSGAGALLALAIILPARRRRA